jgi:hypothetical protein
MKKLIVKQAFLTYPNFNKALELQTDSKEGKFNKVLEYRKKENLKSSIEENQILLNSDILIRY